ncbi:MAG: hypothetical protein JW841_12315 [Deltaproteobacteria bacterium]|nr:hypothetical protein [Deltaproteobacteria bacterium]
MMTKRKQVKSNQQTTERVAKVTALEEQVIRMRKGLSAPVELVLEHKAGNNIELKAKLDAIERRVLEAAGARTSSTKSKIVSALRRKNR